MGALYRGGADFDAEIDGPFVGGALDDFERGTSFGVYGGCECDLYGGKIIDDT